MNAPTFVPPSRSGSWRRGEARRLVRQNGTLAAAEILPCRVRPRPRTSHSPPRSLAALSPRHSAFPAPPVSLPTSLSRAAGTNRRARRSPREATPRLLEDTAAVVNEQEIIVLCQSFSGNPSAGIALAARSEALGEPGGGVLPPGNAKLWTKSKLMTCLSRRGS